MGKKEVQKAAPQRKRLRLNNVISDIRKQYPQIHQEDIQFAAMVYYPIAFVEVEAEEKSVEDFDSVQLMILRFLALGIGRDDIVELTGTTPSYIDKVKGLLFGYGHIDSQGRVTPVGLESIRASANGTPKKIERKLSKRYVQMDALSLAVIPHDRRVDEITFYEKTDTYDKPEITEDNKEKSDPKLFNVGAIAYPEGVTASALEERLVCRDENDSRYDKVIGVQNIHVNITKETIKNIKCLKIRYASACMLVLRDSGTPIVFGKCVTETKKRSSQWFPLGVEADSVRVRYGFEDDVRFLENDAGSYLISMWTRFEDAWQQKRWHYGEKNAAASDEDYLWRVVRYFYPFQEGHYRWQNGELYIDGEAFGSAQRGYAIAKILFSFAEDGFYRFASEDLYGHLVTIRPEASDALLQDVARLLKTAAEQNGARKVDRYLRDHFNETSDTVPSEPEGEQKPPVLEKMRQVLSRFLAGEATDEEEA